MRDFTESTASNEVSYIASDMVIQGNILTGGNGGGNLRIFGSVQGDVSINGALDVEGIITGNTSSASFSSGTGKITGNVTATDSVLIAKDSVIIGNVKGNTVSIEGAVKGDVDVEDALSLGSTAKIMGNIKSRTMTVESGAIITGSCTQCYAPLTAEMFFEQLENGVAESYSEDGYSEPSQQDVSEAEASAVRLIGLEKDDFSGLYEDSEGESEAGEELEQASSL